MKKLMLLLLCLAFAFFPLAQPALADFGDYSGDSDYGGYDDWDDDWGWDDDDDYYGGGYYGGGGGGGGGDSGDTLIILIIVVIILIFVFKPWKRRGGSRSGSRSPAPAAPKAQGAQRTPDSRLRSMQSYTELDESFDAAALTARLSNLYVQMQNCWQNKDITPVRPYFTDALYAQMERQLDSLRRQRRTNYVERIAVLGVVLRGFYQQGGEDHIVAEVRTRIVDYTLDDQSGRLVGGDRDREKFMVYEWDLVRPGGCRTDDLAARGNLHCPNCGAPLSINESARCPYCDAVITLDEHDWVLYAIKGLAQRTQ